MAAELRSDDRIAGPSFRETLREEGTLGRVEVGEQEGALLRIVARLRRSDDRLAQDREVFLAQEIDSGSSAR